MTVADRGWIQRWSLICAHPYHCWVSQIIMFFGTLCTLLILPLTSIVRSDGTLVMLEKQATVKQELKGMWKVLKDRRVWLLVPSWVSR